MQFDPHHVPGSRLPLSTGQSEIWLSEQLEPESTTFRIGEYLEIHGPVDAEIFEEALRQAVAEAEPFNVRFGSEGGVPWQVMQPHPATAWRLPVLDMADAPDPRAAAERWMRADLARTMDLGREPLFSYALFRLGPQRYAWYQSYHHIVTDAAGGALVARRVAELYSAKAAGRPAGPSRFTPLAVLLERDAEYRESADFAADRAYWAERFADYPEPPRLAGRRATVFAHPLRETTLLSEAEAARLRAAARACGTHWSAMMMAITAGYLHRMTGTSDIVLSLPVAARTDAALRAAPGMLANIVPLRLTVAPRLRVREFVRRVSREVRTALRHQRYRRIDLARDLQLPDGGRGLLGPHVNVMSFGYDFDFAGHDVTAHNLSNGLIEDLSIMAYDRSDGQGMRIDLNANGHLYGAADLAAHRGRFLRLLHAFADAADTDRAIGSVELLDETERHRAVRAGNATAREVTRTTLPELLAARARRTPRRTALVFGATRLDYAELDAAAERLARRLVARGAGPERTVAVALPRSADLVVALLAVLKSGAAYLPLDLDHPAERLRLTLEDAAPTLVLTRADTAAALPLAGSGVPRLLLDVPEPRTTRAALPRPRAGAACGPLPAPLPENPAYVIYTSGSTGRPKGVSVSHQAIVNRLSWMQETYRLGPEDRVLQKTPAGFDVSVWEFFWPLLTGATLVVARPGGHQDPAYLARVIRQQHITTLHFVPSMLQAFLDEPAAARCGAGLRRVVCSGEALPRETVDRFHALLPGVALHNLYGPTEAAVDVTYHPCEPGAAGPVPIGRPVWNTRVYVLDCALRPCPPGTPGELYLSGAQLARGYLHRPALTAERFTADPYGPLFGEPGARMYRTGDLARLLPDGAVEYLGRTDDQVKLRGVRIELGEVEAALRALPGVAQAAAVVREDTPGDRRLVGYLVPGPGAPPEPAAAREALDRTLPAPMVPAALVLLDALPLSVNGKLDRRALPAPAFEAAASGRAPRTPREELLCGLFGEVLGVPGVTIDDDFFHLGGHSLLASRLVSRIGAELGVELSIRALLDAPTVAELVGRLHEAAGGSASDRGHGLDPLLPLRARGGRPPLFCVHPGGGLGWAYAKLLRHLGPEQPVYTLQARALSSPEAVPPASVAEMAEDYVAQLRAVRPDGPYHLLGWSFGGLVAHAMATQLQEGGAEVGLLAVLDAYPDNWRTFDDLPELSTRQWLGVLLDDIGGRDITALRPDGGELDAEALAAELSRKTGLPARLLAGRTSFPLLDILRNDMELMRKFTPDRFRGDLLLFTAEERVRGYRRDPAHVPEAWREYTDGAVTVHHVHAQHYEMLRDEHLRGYAPLLARALRAAQAGSLEVTPAG
ncbi:amino acid adenylation domain-containing protein [Streptomyces sp. LX-29]|uniref:amino acid adenylation domain-containing protein n=1 Tax=Streptomyces sp. LX-29 TaxID=2900152 RepID=UPI00240DDB4E|nr:amino acid adenylation domain-containing protein [Streptomyces sp. LX-29]WFB09234.1 amino acid adenylation domain-containing protein [Streptomyces sp. LX-29]